MNGLFLGFALGAMAFTEHGREIGNQIGSAAILVAKKVMEHAKDTNDKPAERAS